MQIGSRRMMDLSFFFLDVGEGRGGDGRGGGGRGGYQPRGGDDQQKKRKYDESEEIATKLNSLISRVGDRVVVFATLASNIESLANVLGEYSSCYLGFLRFKTKVVDYLM